MRRLCEIKAGHELDVAVTEAAGFSDIRSRNGRATSHGLTIDVICAAILKLKTTRRKDRRNEG